jgi:Domain of unknown function (DUF4111)
VCRAHGRSLLGAAPAELVGEVPDRWVVAAGDAQLAAWQAIRDDPPYAELTALTACRVWRFAEEGRHASKAAGAARRGTRPRLAATLSGRRAQLVYGGGEPAWIGDREAVPEAGQPGSQLGKASGRAPVLGVVR